MVNEVSYNGATDRVCERVGPDGAARVIELMGQARREFEGYDELPSLTVIRGSDEWFLGFAEVEGGVFIDFGEPHGGLTWHSVGDPQADGLVTYEFGGEVSEAPEAWVIPSDALVDVVDAFLRGVDLLTLPGYVWEQD